MTGDPGIITVELPDLSQLAEQPRSIGGIKGNTSSTYYLSSIYIDNDFLAYNVIRLNNISNFPSKNNHVFVSNFDINLWSRKTADSDVQSRK